MADGRCLGGKNIYPDLCNDLGFRSCAHPYSTDTPICVRNHISFCTFPFNLFNKDWQCDCMIIFCLAYVIIIIGTKGKYSEGEEHIFFTLFFCCWGCCLRRQDQNWVIFEGYKEKLFNKTRQAGALEEMVCLYAVFTPKNRLPTTDLSIPVYIFFSSVKKNLFFPPYISKNQHQQRHKILKRVRDFFKLW